MKITCLIENTTENSNLKCEHGLSLFIETMGLNILFDMGQTDLFCENASKLNIDLTKTDIAILSHGHYDHGGGLRKFIEVNKKAPIYINKNAFGSFYNGTSKYIGLDSSLIDNERFVCISDEHKINDKVFLFTLNNSRFKFNLGSFGLNKFEDDEFTPDDFKHEQYLLINENGKRILFSGCSHKGIMDIVNIVQPDVLIGGFHFSKLPLDDKLASYASYLNNFTTVYYTCHCTGIDQYNFMKDKMHNLNYLSEGKIINI